MALQIKAPQPYPTDKPLLFLGGTIDQGAAEDWQSIVVRELSAFDIVILNPRREEWDDSWEQSIDNPEFSQQVRWELTAQRLSSVLLYVFGSDEKEAKKAKAPITLLELGLHAKDHDILVCCPPGYWRKGNVDIVCQEYGIPVYVTLEDLLQDLKALLQDSGEVVTLLNPVAEDL